MKSKEPLSVYVHIPFCVKKCNYCDFLSFPVGKASPRKDYVNSLLREIELLPERISPETLDLYEVSTVFFGGGTPNTLPAEELVRILCKLKSRFSFSRSPEISVELNPGVFSLTGRNEAHELSILKEAGFNRLSLGAESLDPGILKRLGRIHTPEDFFSLYNCAVEAGFQNINTDLMSALPGQTAETLLSDLERVISLSPAHISLYSLILEPGTPFGDAPESSLSLPGEETVLIMDREARSLLRSHDYQRYEISNFSLPGRECAHNLTYWNRGAYLGFGLGAASLFRNVRRSNTRSLPLYLEAPGKDVSEEHALSEREAMEEFMFLGLRKTMGIRESDFLRAFMRPLSEVFGPELSRQVLEGFMLHEGDFWRYTDEGLDLSTPLLARFLE